MKYPFQIAWIWGAFQADPKVELNSHQQYIDSANKKAPSTVADIVVQHDFLESNAYVITANNSTPFGYGALSGVISLGS